MTMIPDPGIDDDLRAAYDGVGTATRSDTGNSELEDPAELDDVLGELREDIEQAISLYQSDFEGDRERSQKYYNGESDLELAAENRSKYVATKVRDAIRAVRPDLMRTLLGTTAPVEFLPATAVQGEIADQQTDYVYQLFNRLGGWSVVYAAIHTSALHKMGPVKVYYDKSGTWEYSTYSGMTDAQVEAFGDRATVHDSRTVLVPGDDGVTPIELYDIEVAELKSRGKVKLEALPVEDFLIDEHATSDADYRLIAHRRNIGRGEALAMGFDEEDVSELDAQDPEMYDHVGLSEARRGYQLRQDEYTSQDASMDQMLLTECYYWADLEGGGPPQLWRFWMGGTSYKYLDHERVEDHPFCFFSLDPEPFTVWGKSIYDLIHRDQDVNTSLLRAVVDNAHMTNNARLAVHETMVNMEDVLNNELGAPIRVRGQGNIQPLVVPFTGQQLIPLVQYLDDAVDNKTGVTRASVGLEPGALQSTNRDAVLNTIQKQAGQIELMARNLAETGMLRMFRLLLRLTLQNPDPVEIMRIHGSYVPAPLHVFDPELDLAVTLGSSRPDEKLEALGAVKDEQEKIIALLGPGNPVVSLAQVFNTIHDSLEIRGIHNVRRYMSPITPEVEAQVAQYLAGKEQQANQGPGDPTQAILQAEQIKAQSRGQEAQMKAQVTTQKDQALHQREMIRMQLDATGGNRDLAAKTDLERDRMIQDLNLRLADMQTRLNIAEMQAGTTRQTQIDTAQIAARTQMQQAANNPPGGT